MMGVARSRVLVVDVAEEAERLARMVEMVGHHAEIHSSPDRVDRVDGVDLVVVRREPSSASSLCPDQVGVPVVYVSAHASVDDVIGWLREGADDVVVGPLARLPLRDAIARQLKETHRAKALARSRGEFGPKAGGPKTVVGRPTAEGSGLRDPLSGPVVDDQSPRSVVSAPFIEARSGGGGAPKPEPICASQIPKVLRQAVGTAEGMLLIDGSEESLSVEVVAVQKRALGIALELTVKTDSVMPQPGAGSIIWFAQPGGVHGFRSVVERVCGDTVELAPPRAVMRYCRRAHPRYELASVDRTRITLPFGDGSRWCAEGQVLDISVGGFAIDLPEIYGVTRGELVRMGLSLGGSESHDALVVVRREGPLVGNSRTVGVELVHTPDAGHEAISRFIKRLAKRGARQLERHRVTDVPDLRAL